MDEKINKDKLESNFRKKLRDQKPADGGWNIPSDDLWGKLDNELDKEAFPKRKKKKRIFFLLMPLLLLSAAFFLYHSFNKTTTPDFISSSTTEQESVSPEKNAEISVATSVENDSNETKSNTEKTLQKNINPSQSFSESETIIADKKATQVNTNTSDKKIKTNSIKHKTSKKQPIASTVLQNPVSNFKVTTVPQKKSITANTTPAIVPFRTSKESIKKSSKATIDKQYAFISLPNLLTPLPLDRPTTSDQKVSPYPSLKFPKRMTLGIYYAPSLSFANVKDQLSSSVESIDIQRNAAYANRFGLNLEKQVARHWSFGLGLEYTHFRVDSEYLVGVPYSSDNERQNAMGNYEKNYQHSLPSSFGKLNTEFGLDRLHDEIVNENDLLNVTMSLSHQLHLLSIPLYARYHIDQNKWRYSLTAGVQTNFWLGQPKTTLTSSLSHHTSIHHRHTSVKNEATPELNNTTFGYLFGLGIEYQIADQISASFQPNFQGSFTTLYKDDNFKNYPSSFGIQVGLRYQF